MCRYSSKYCIELCPVKEADVTKACLEALGLVWEEREEGEARGTEVQPPHPHEFLTHTRMPT